MKTLSERIKEAQEELVSAKDSLLEMTQALEQTPDDDGILAQVDELTITVERKTAQLNTLQKAESALAERAKAQKIEGPTIVRATGKDTDREELWLKQAVCAFIGHVQRKAPDQVRQERYGKNKALEMVMTKTAVDLGTTFDTDFAAELVREDTRGFINLLTPTSIAAALAGRALSLDFGGYDSVRIPRRGARGATGTNLGGAFVGEGGAIPLGRLSVTSSTLSRYKMAVISTFSRELAERSTPAVEAIVRQAILDDMSVELDAAFLDANAAVTGIRPAGIANGVTPTTGTANGGVDAVVADIKAGLAALTTAGLGARPVLLVNSTDAMSVGFMQTALGEFIFRDSIAGNNLMGVEIIKSLNVPQGTAFMVDANQLATAFDPASFDVSDVATVVEANSDGTAPTMAEDPTTPGDIGTAGQVPRNGGIMVSETTPTNAVGQQTRSLWQTYSIGVRAVKPVSWGFMQDGAVVYFTGLSW